MRIETKSAAILLATLCIGVLVGMLTQGALQNSRLNARDRMERDRIERDRAAGGRGGDAARPAGFVAHMESMLQLRADQVARVRPILDARAEFNQRIIDAAHRQLRSGLDSTSTTLAPLLDDAQRMRLADLVARPPDPFHRGPQNGGPPPR